MPLRDHFRSPVNDTHSWDEVHGQWPGEIVRHLATILPPGFRAAPKVNLGAPFEVDVNTDDLDSCEPDIIADFGDSSSTLIIEADLSEQDEYEVRIYYTAKWRQLVAVIEIVSPSNKDRPVAREVFVGKVVSLLQQGVCVSLVDLVTSRQANLYAELLNFLGHADPALANPTPHLYAATLRSRKPPKKRKHMLEAWFYPMVLGQPLPTLPIWLNPDRILVALPLEISYQETCRILGIA